MPAFLKGALRAIFLALNTIGTFSLMIPASLIKLVTPAGSSVRSLCDRLLNALAAHHQYHGPLIVIDFGTATTFDVVSGKGEYLGGVIAPGINLSLETLHRAAAKEGRSQSGERNASASARVQNHDGL